MSDTALRSGLIRLAFSNPELRSALLPLIMKEAKSFEDAVKGKKFKHPETGNDVLFGSLPSEVQTKIRSQWVKKNPRGSGGDGSDPKAMLKEDSDKYFAQHVSGNIGKKSLTDALKGTGFKPRGKGSFDKKRGLVELYLDSEDRSSSPMRAVFSGSDYHKNDGKGYIRIEHPSHGHIDDAFDMTGDPEADAKAMHSALKDLAKQMGDYEKERKRSKKATTGGDMAAVLDAEADPTSHDQNLPEHYYFGKTAEERLENIEKMLSQFASPASKDQNKPQSYYGLPPKGKQASVKAASRPLGPGVHLIEDLSVLGPNFRLVFRELGGDFLGSEQVPGYYLDLGGLLKLVYKTPKMSPAGDAQAKKTIAKLLAMMKAGSTKTAGGSGAANAAYLRQSPLKNKILQAVAKHYGTSVSAIEAELTDPDAEAVFEYIGNDAALQMQVYREFNAKGFGKRAAAGISVTLKKPVTLKDGTVIEAGTRGTLRFNEQVPRQVIVDFDTRPNTKLGVANLFDYFGRPFMKVPSMSSLSRMADGLSKTVTGKTVEPDGYGPDGSPSWLLILGMV